MADPIVVAPVAPVSPNTSSKASPSSPNTSGQPKPVTSTPVTFEFKGDNGEILRLTKAEAEKRLSKGNYADNLAKQSKAELKQAAQDRAEAATLKKALAAAKSNPDVLSKLLAEHGIDEFEYARAVANKHVQRQTMTAEQLRTQELEQQVSEYKQWQAQENAKLAQAKHAQISNTIANNMQDQLFSAATKAGLMTADSDGKHLMSPDLFAAMYEVVQEVSDLGLEWNPEMILEHAQDRLNSVSSTLEKQVLSNLKGKALEDRLGPKVIEEILRHRLAETRAKKNPSGVQGYQAKPNASSTSISPDQRDASREYQTPAQLQEWLKTLGKK